MTQTQARRLARQQRDSSGIPSVAAPYPPNSWGGREKTWAVYLLVSGSLELLQIEEVQEAPDPDRN